MSPLPADVSVILEKSAFFTTLSPFFSIFTDSFRLFADNIYVKQLKKNNMFKKENLTQTIGLFISFTVIIPCLTMILVHVITTI